MKPSVAVVAVGVLVFIASVQADQKTTQKDQCMEKAFPIDLKQGQKASTTCLSELGLKLEDFPSDAMSYKSESFDDKCYTKCMGEGIGLVKDNKLQEKALMDIVEKGTDSSIKDKIKPALKECVSSNTKQIESKDENELCKGFKNLWTCIIETVEKAC